MQPTDTRDPTYYRKIVDCQWACPAHTPVPEYIRLVAQGRYDDAYLVNWQSNVFPGILGRVCDRPCEPACRRARVEQNNQGKPEPVAICRLKRIAADNQHDVKSRLPRAGQPTGKRIACVGAGPASLTVARDLAVLGHEVMVFDAEARTGGFMRSEVPRFRLPEKVLDEECGHVLELGVKFSGGHRIDSLRDLLAENHDAVFIGSGAPRGRDLEIPGRRDAAGHIHIGIDWLASVAFGHIAQAGKRVIVLGGGNTAMDCCRSALRLGSEHVKVIVRSGYEEMKASPWEKEDAIHEGIEILNFLVPRTFEHDNGVLTGMTFQRVTAQYESGRRKLVPTGDADLLVPCDEVLIAVGQENAFPWIERDIGVAFGDDGLPVLDPVSMQSTHPRVFFGGDAAFGPKNIITAVAHGHAAAISIDLMLNGREMHDRPPVTINLVSQKMGIHEWTYHNDVSVDMRHAVRWENPATALHDIRTEAELGFDPITAIKEAERCLNCDIQTVFQARACIECDACADICPVDAISFTPPAESETELRRQLRAPATNLDQAVYVSDALKTGKVLVKDEDVCLHCGLCAERCPSGAWDMQKMIVNDTYAGQPSSGATSHPLPIPAALHAQRIAK